MDLQSVTVDAMRALGKFLETRIAAIGMSPARLSDETGISRPAIYRLFKAKTAEDADRAQKRIREQIAIALKFREWAALLNAWRDDNVLAGLDKTEPQAVKGEGAYRRAVPPNLMHPSMIPLPVPNWTAAGSSAQTTDLGYGEGLADKYILLPPHAAADPDAFVVEVRGDSAWPYLRPGDFVVCSPNAPQVPGAFYFVQHTGELDESHRLKLVYPLDNERLELRSANVRYAPVVVSRETVGKMALALYVIRPMDEVMKNP